MHPPILPYLQRLMVICNNIFKGVGGREAAEYYRNQCHLRREEN